MTPQIIDLSNLCFQSTQITSELYQKCEKIPCEGQIFYRGLEIWELVNGFTSENRYGFEEITYLLLFGSLPTQDELEKFKTLLSPG